MELTGLSYPEEYGGAGADLVTQAIVAEELARVDASASLIFLISKLGMLPVLNFGVGRAQGAGTSPASSTGESQAQLLPVRGRRRLRRRLDDHAGRARR